MYDERKASMIARAGLTRQTTEEQLGEDVRDACLKLGWKFLWLRRTQHSSKGILDLLLIPIRRTDRRHILHRELKGYDKNGRLGRVTDAQQETIDLINDAGGDARMWQPADWTSGEILRELR